jgi:potassium-transporting ATPase KdpC subunit
MKTFLEEVLISVRATLVFAILLCGLFPLIIFGAGQLFFPRQADGSLIESNDRRILGSELLGQNFGGAKYFHSRPSAAGANGYDAASSSGSNLGPTSQKLIDAVKQRAESYRAKNGLAADALVPGDAVTASGSGLDPHISLRNADLQVPRVARERGIDLAVSKPLSPKRQINARWAFSVTPALMFLNSILPWTARISDASVSFEKLAAGQIAH